MRQQPVDSCHSNVIDPFNFVAHQFGRDHCFFGNRNIAGPCRNYSDQAPAVVFAISPQDDGARRIFKLRATNGFLHRSKLIFRGPRDQNILPVLRQLPENSRHLCRRLSRSENHLRHSGPQRAVMVHFGKSQVFKGKMPEPVDGIVSREFARSYPLEKFANGLGVHEKQSALSIQPTTS